MKKTRCNHARAFSRPTRGFKGHIFDSQLEADVSWVLGEQATPLGGYQHGQIKLAIKYQTPNGKECWYVPDFGVTGHAKLLIESKARVDKRSRDHLEAALRQGYRIGVVFPNPRASTLPLFKGAHMSMGQWLEAHGIRYVTSPSESPALLQQLISTSTNYKGDKQ
jgi:hypothetical protein